ncbi:unnamed protein product [Lupinus luteus]|uniref:Uncharacterized protein n=1 Tax=Lupinus luteus TaxID=3873 RepID=A0AAV1Y6K5_LUPLU
MRWNCSNITIPTPTPIHCSNITIPTPTPIQCSNITMVRFWYAHTTCGKTIRDVVDVRMWVAICDSGLAIEISYFQGGFPFSLEVAPTNIRNQELHDLMTENQRAMRSK